MRKIESRPQPVKSTGVVDVALVGNPNSGKTSVFNALTGLRQKVGNYPGVTVERKTGLLNGENGLSVRLHDLPGLYSLVPKSLDDKIAADVLTGRSPEARDLRLIVVVADASNLSRNLYLVTQIIELGKPVLLALNMMDVAKSRGLQIDVQALEKTLGVPVIPLVANKGTGIAELRRQILTHVSATRDEIPEPDFPLDKGIEQKLVPICRWVREHSQLQRPASCAEALRILSTDRALECWRDAHDEAFTQLQKMVTETRAALTEQQVTWSTLETDFRYRRIDQIYQRVVRETKSEELTFSERLDKILTHRIAGPLIFIFIFALIFQTIFTWAEVPMNAIEQFVGWVGTQIALVMPPGVLQDLIVNGAIAGVGAVLVFLPQILFLFFFLSLLEDSGYMARIAFIMDRFMRGVGLSGRSVIPLLSSFACAVPGIMATRTIQNTRDRLITIMIAPFMSCSARLPVYVLMIGAFIPASRVLGIFTLPGLTLLSMYLLGIVAAIVAALVMKRLAGKGQKPSTFVMELPPYRRPSLRWTSLQMVERAKIFVRDAGRVILAISIVLWFLASYPRPKQDMNPSTAIRHSYAGQIGHVMEPVIKPLGFDWKIGIGLITAFAAREVFVSTMATIYNVEEQDEHSVTLRQALRADRDPETGRHIYTPLTAISLMVFFVLACQCMSTVAIVKRETNSWRWPLTMVVYMTTLAYLASLVVFQGGKLLGLG